MKSRNRALAVVLIALAVLFYAVSVVRMTENEDRRHQQDPAAHNTKQSSWIDPSSEGLKL